MGGAGEDLERGEKAKDREGAAGETLSSGVIT